MNIEIIIDRDFGLHEDEGFVIMSSTLSGEKCRIHVDNDVWDMVLRHFNIETFEKLSPSAERCFIAMERICVMVIEKRSFPQYGVLKVSID